MRTQTVSLLLLLCVVGSVVSFSLEESIKMATKRITPNLGSHNKISKIVKVLDKVKDAIKSKQINLTSADSYDQNQTIVISIINGFYQENNLANPTELATCVDSNDATLIVNFLPVFLSKASSLLTINAAITAAQNLASQISPSFVSCFEQSPEASELSTVYDISAINPITAISWLTSNISAFTSEFSALNKLWKAQNYSGLGNNAAGFVHTVLNAISSVNLTSQSGYDQNQTIVISIINGFYQENNLANPTELATCVDSNDATLIVNFLPVFLSKASSLLTINAAITAAQNLASQISPSFVSCFEDSPEASELSTVYDISAINPITAISWLTNNISAFTSEFSALNKLWKAQNYSGLGNNAAGFVHTVLNAISSVHLENLTLTNWEVMQQYFNGFYAQQNLPNPTYINQCYNDKAVAEYVAFQPTFLKKAGSVSTIEAAFADLDAFDKDQDIKYPEINICLEGNQEIANLRTALGIKHPETVNETVKAYINANLFSTTSEFSNASKSWNSGNYVQSGKQVSAWTKKSLAKN